MVGLMCEKYILQTNGFPFMDQVDVICLNIMLKENVDLVC